MWVSPSAPSRKLLHHAIVSHSFDQGIVAECAMLGTKDYSAMLAIPAAMKFIDDLGGLESISLRNKSLCSEAVQLLSTGWGTEAFVQPEKLRSPSMAMVGLPAALGDTWTDSEKIRLLLLSSRDKSIVVQKLFPVNGDRLYFRVSAAIYNCIEDFEILRDAVLEIAQNC